MAKWIIIEAELIEGSGLGKGKSGNFMTYCFIHPKKLHVNSTLVIKI
jgi:hypothetical protein